MDRALVFLTKNQNADGSFGPASDADRRIAITSAGLLAFFAAGDAPDLGQFGSAVRAATNYLIQTSLSKMPAETQAAMLTALGEVAGIDDNPSDQTRLGQLLGKDSGDPRIIPLTGKLSAAARTLLALRDNGSLDANAISYSALYRAAVFAAKWHLDDLTRRIDALIISHQRPDGSWDGDSESTAFAILALTATDHLMPLAV